MPTLIESPTVIAAAGNKPKRIEEYVGRVNSGHENASVARMQSPSGWVEPGQRPDFEEITVVLKGMPARPWLHIRESGFATRVQVRMARSTLRFVCRRSRWRGCTGIDE